MFLEPKRDVRIVVHGDDFTILGDDKQLDWFRDTIGNRLELKFKARLGAKEKDDESVRIVIRVIQWDHTGIKYEADQRHAENIVKALEPW